MKKKNTEELRMRLYKAIWDKNSTPEQIKQLIAEGALLDDRDDRVPPLYFAAEGGRADIVEVLLESGEGEKRMRPEVALAYAIYGGHAHIVRTLLAAGANVNTDILIRVYIRPNSEEYRTLSLLSLAVMMERGDIIDLLLDTGADINCKTEGFTPLSLAALTGDLELMQHLIDRGADVNGATYYTTPLIVAAKEGCVESLRFLLDRGANVNAGADAEDTPLTAAARAGFTEGVRLLLDAGADVNLPSRFTTPLIAAAEGSHTDVLRILLAAGADVNVGADAEDTPLTAAAERSHTDVLRILLAAGADVNVGADAEDTPLTAAAQAGFTEGVRLLLNAGANVNLSSFHRTPFAAAVEGGKTKIISMLFAAGADVTAVACGSGRTALMAALGRNNLSLAHRLRRAGAIDQLPKYTYNTWEESNSLDKLRVRLYEAIENENSTPEQIRQLIDAGALRKLTNKEEKSFFRSPLYIAAQAGRADVVKLLLDAGADVVDFVGDGWYDGCNGGPRDGWYGYGPRTALSVAALRGHTDVVQTLIKVAEADEKRLDLEGALRSAVYAGNVDIIRQLLEAGAEIDCPQMCRWSRWHRFLRLKRDETFISLFIKAERQDRINFLRWSRIYDHDEETPLSLAIKTERWDIIDLLLDAGAEINLAANEYDTPLGLAARIGDTELMQHLIDRGADVHGAKAARTPLIAAAWEGCVESVRFLLEARDYYTPLSAGARYANEQFVPIARILLDAGADVNKATWKYTPLIAAAKAANGDGVRLLLEAGADVNKATWKYTPLIAAAKTGNTELVRLLLEAGADVNLPSRFTTPLIAAAEGSHTDVLRILLAAGADLSDEADGNTPLIAAAKVGFTEGVRLLLAAGADVNLSTFSYTPLIAAARARNTELVRLLLEAGADVNRASEDATPLIAAASNNRNIQTAKLLVEAGADVNAEADGKTALTIAVARVDPPLAHFLRRAGASDGRGKNGTSQFHRTFVKHMSTLTFLPISENEQYT